MTTIIIRVPKKREKEEFKVIFQPARKHQKKIRIEEKCVEPYKKKGEGKDG